ncbi:MAG: tripartite tricarboxylate transporter TctB family protein [Clostridiales bacterium]|nr:tripartite tricarboxylate transporter TctB family protein [Clostridiales bacterium]
MKKTGTKAFSNLVSAIIFIILCAWAWIQTGNFQTVNDFYVQPSTFPRVMIIGLLFFSVVLLIQAIVQLSTMKEGDPAAEPAESINVFKDKGVQAALVVIVLCILFTALFKTLGYVICAAIICAIIMYMIGKRELKQMVLVSILVPLGMWLIFFKILTVNIPMGPLTFLRDLLNMI